ncbi:hypothetical protein Q7P37_003472 [Cladosporium fusiforme]
MDHPYSASSRPQARRGPSGAWNRLKPVTIDPLDAYGLPSKGDKRLYDHKTQEAYYTKIIERYMKFCAASSGGEDLENAFSSLSIASSSASTAPKPNLPLSEPATRPQVPRQPSSTDRPNDLPNILMAMRRLREGILGSRRRDAFAQRAYMFIAQASILTRQWESYQPALLHLVHDIHAQTPLSPLELRDFVGYMILDLACRQNELVQAYALKLKFAHQDRRVAAVLKALVHDDWPRFWRVRRAVDGYQRTLMGFAEERMKMHALKALGRSYLSADKAFVERSADAKWEELIQSGVGWQLQDNGTVVIRKPKPK